MADIYDYSVPRVDGSEQSLAEFKGKADGKVINEVVGKLTT